MRLSNERLTTAPSSATGNLIERHYRKTHRPNQLAAMKIDRPKSVRWCSAWSTPINVQNHG